MDFVEQKNKIREKRQAAMVCNSVIFVAEFATIIRDLQKEGFYIFRYYTVVSNVIVMLAAMYFLYASVRGKAQTKKRSVIFRYTATCMLILTVLIVVAVLTPADAMKGISPAKYYIGRIATVHHVINPTLSIVSFVFFEDNSVLEKRHVFVALSLTVIYSVVLLILNFLRVLVGPYVFLYIYQQPKWATLLWFVGINTFTYILNCVTLRIGKK